MKTSYKIEIAIKNKGNLKMYKVNIFKMSFFA